MPRTTCPHCGREVDAPDTGAPYFCSGCHGIVDPGHLLRPGQGAPPPDRPPDRPGDRPGDRTGSRPTDRPGGGQDGGELGATRVGEFRPAPQAPPASPPQYVSRYGTTQPREVSAPGPGLAAGGSLAGALVLAALAAAVVGGGLGWLAANQFRVPLLYAGVTGWAMKRAFAIGGGGGTPDRGFVGTVLLFALCGGAYVFALYAEYDATSLRQNAHYREIFGDGGLREAEDRLRELAARDPNRTGRVDLQDGTTVSLAQESERLRLAQATDRTPGGPYDVALLAATGRTGFTAWIEACARGGTEFRFSPKHQGFHLAGIAVIGGWLLEFALLVGIAFTRIE